jgi:2-polyprenyl-6-methoxyphenol hydroxylase-like FAD-dependent oxidoreductase
MGCAARIGDHAVVMGTSMAGLLAARVLADFYRTVTVVERDALPETPGEPTAVPQGRHGHVLLRRGSQILSDLFPGLMNELVADGVPVWDDGDLSKIDVLPWAPDPAYRSVRRSLVDGGSGPLLEFHVRDGSWPSRM